MQDSTMRPGAGKLSALALTALLACGAALVGCGDGSGDGAKAGPTAGGGLVSWPLFGRVPERTQYLPAHKRALDPPLRAAWSINTHALIEFPPAVASGVAYV